MTEYESKFADTGEHSRDSRDGARQSSMLPAVGRSVPANAKSLRTAATRQRPARTDYAVGAFLVGALAVAAFAFGRLRASSVVEPARPEPYAATQPSAAPRAVPGAASPRDPALAVAPTPVPQRRELALIPFVPIEVEPANGEIWLDREVAGIGSVQLGAIDDGKLHELKFVAPGHETKTLFFRNAPPAGRVVLERIIPQRRLGQEGLRQEGARQDAVAVKAMPRTARNEVPSNQRNDQPSVDTVGSRTNGAYDPARTLARGGSTVSPAQPARTRPSAGDSTQSASAALKKAPHVQLIEVRLPRVEVLD